VACFQDGYWDLGTDAVTRHLPEVSWTACVEALMEAGLASLGKQPNSLSLSPYTQKPLSIDYLVHKRNQTDVWHNHWIILWHTVSFIGLTGQRFGKGWRNVLCKLLDKDTSKFNLTIHCRCSVQVHAVWSRHYAWSEHRSYWYSTSSPHPPAPPPPPPPATRRP
jgi:hypothetical protein